MGAEKFFDIKCRASGLAPDAAVVVATVRALKMHGGVGKIVAGKPLDPALARGERRGRPDRRREPREADRERPRSSASRSSSRSTRSRPTRPAEVEAIRQVALAAGARDAVVATHFVDGGDGAADLAQAVWARPSSGEADFKLLYPDDAPARREDPDDRDEDLRRGRRSSSRRPPGRRSKLYEDLGFGHLPVCMAKTQYSLSHDAEPEGRARAGSRSRSATSACRPERASSRRSSARCGRCRGCRRGRAARTSTSTPTGNIVGLF